MPDSQGKLEKTLIQIPYQHIFIPRSCIRSGLVTHTLFTLGIHGGIFSRIKSKMADFHTELRYEVILIINLFKNELIKGLGVV